MSKVTAINKIIRIKNRLNNNRLNGYSLESYGADTIISWLDDIQRELED